MVAAVSAFAIPLVINYQSDKSRNNDNVLAVEARTLQAMNDLDQRIADVIDDKIKLDTKYNTSGPQRFAAEYINDVAHVDVQGKVYRLLNLYDFVCVGVKDGLLSRKMVGDMRGDALRQTWQDYGPYIKTHRAKSAGINAWTNCDKWDQSPSAAAATYPANAPRKS